MKLETRKQPIDPCQFRWACVSLKCRTQRPDISGGYQYVRVRVRVRTLVPSDRQRSKSDGS